MDLRCSFCHDRHQLVIKYLKRFNTCPSCIIDYKLHFLSHKEISDLRKYLNRKRQSTKALEQVLLGE